MGLLGKKKTVKYYDTVRYQAKDDFARGRELYEASLRGLDSLDGDFSAQIAGGGLTPDMEREFDVAHGRVADLVSKSRRSWGADLLQAARRTGGTMDANTALAYQLERDGDLDEKSFEASSNITFQKASARMARTDRLYNQILDIRARKAGLSQAERDRAAQMWLSAIAGRSNYQAQILGAGTHTASGVMGAGVTGQTATYTPPNTNNSQGGW